MSDQGRYRKLFTRLWRHPGFVALTEAEQNLALYVLTGPQTNRIGLYVLSPATAAEDLGTTPETLKKRLVNVCGTFGWSFDAVARVFYIPSWWRWNPPENVNVMKGNLKDLNDIPPCGLVDAFARNLETLPQTLHETFLEGLRQRLPKPSRNQEPYQGTESVRQEQEPSALCAVADNEDIPTPNARHVAIAREVTANAPRHSRTDYLIDAFQDQCRHQKVETSRLEAVAALTAARAGRAAQKVDQSPLEK